MSHPVVRLRRAGVVLLAIGAAILVTRTIDTRPPTAAPSLRFEGLSTFPVESTHSVALDNASSLLSVIGDAPWVVLKAAPVTAPLSGVSLRVRPMKLPEERRFLLYFVPVDTPGGAFSSDWMVSGEISATPDWWTIRWRLPEPAAQVRLDFAAGAYEIGELVLGDANVAGLAASGVVRSLIVLVGAWLLVAVAFLWAVGTPRVAWTDARSKRLLVLALACPVVLIVFLMPPFQGPDEDAAWKLALFHYRSSIAEEPALFYLPDLLNANALKFHPGTRMASDRLLLSGFETPPPPESVLEEYRRIRPRFKYGNWYAYPIVWFVGLFFPVVANAQQALLYYYLCRLATGVLFLGAVEWFRRRFDLPYTAIAFFALPAVVQQFATISVDATVNLLTIAAIGLFVHTMKRPALASELSLLVVTLGISAIKFTYAGVLLLPLVVLLKKPLRLTTFGWSALLLGSAVLIAGGLLALRIIISLSRDQAIVAYGSADAFDAHFRALHTWAGWHDFLSAYQLLVKGMMHPEGWAGPLGWVDTVLGPEHVAIVTVLVAAALILDVWQYGPAVVNAFRTRSRDVTRAAVVIAGTFFIGSFTNSLVFYLISTPVGFPFIAGAHPRHLFHTGIMAVLLPMWIVGGTEAGAESGRVCSLRAPVALVSMGVLLAAAAIELAMRLATRYW